MAECSNIFEKFKGIKEWVNIFRQKETYLYLLKNTNLIPEQRKKVETLRKNLELAKRELDDAEKKLNDQITVIPELEKWLEEHRTEYEVKEQLAAAEVQKLAEKVQKELDDAAKSS